MFLNTSASDCSVEVTLDDVQPKLQHKVDSVTVKISVVQKSCSTVAVASPRVESPLSSAVRRPTQRKFSKTAPRFLSRLLLGILLFCASHRRKTRDLLNFSRQESLKMVGPD
jgi:hypothetical protein